MMKMKHLATFFENLFDLVFGIPGVELFWQGTLGAQYQFFKICNLYSASHRFMTFQKNRYNVLLLVLFKFETFKYIYDEFFYSK